MKINPRNFFISIRCVAALLAGFLASCAQTAATPQPEDIWFDDLLSRKPVNYQVAETTSNILGDVVFGREGEEGQIDNDIPQIDKPQIIFVTISDGHGRTQIFSGRGATLQSAVKEVTAHINTAISEGLQAQWLKVDIVRKVIHYKHSDLDAPQELDRSLYGLAFDQQSQLAFLPGELTARTLLNSEGYFRFGNIASYLGDRGMSYEFLEELEAQQEASLYRFTTRSYFLSREGEFLELYRDHRLFGRLEPEFLIQSVTNAGDYLARAVQPDGKFDYIYYPKTDNVPDEYNMVRHAGTVYAMMELYQVYPDPALLDAGRRAIQYMLNSLMPCGDENAGAVCLVENDWLSLGGNSLAVIALAEYTRAAGNSEYLPEMAAMARWITASQSEAGEFMITYQRYSSGAINSDPSPYFPGEALLALLRLYAVNGDEILLDAAEAGAHWLIEVRDQGLADEDLPADHWLSYALNELDLYRPNSLYREHGFRIASNIADSQNRFPDIPDWRGSYYTPPRSTPTATRGEALYAAYQLAVRNGRDDLAHDYLEALRLGARFQQCTQFWPENSLYVDDPQRGLGGFHRDLSNFEIRIDYVQHNISSLLGLYKIEIGLIVSQ